MPPTNNKKKNGQRRSAAWFSRQDIYGFIYRSWTKNRGVPNDQFDGRPVIGICNTWSELTPCNTHFRVLAEHVRNGILEAGGFPLEFPVMSLGETLMRPTAMLYRNLAAMSVEESIRANPLDAVVLLAGCDKTTPSTIMGAASVDLPTILVSGGPMLSGKYRGTDIGSGTNVWSMSEDLRAGKITVDEFHEAESCMHRSHGHCMTMGTASTMASMVEAVPMVMQWPGERDMPDSALMKSASVISPAFTASLNCQTEVPEPTSQPRNLPFSIGPPDRAMVGRSQLAAPISKAGVVLSQPTSSTTPSIGLARIDSSTSMLARLRNSIAVGRKVVSPSDIAGNSTGKPPAS